MARRLTFRVLQLVATVAVVVILVFVLQFVVPGDPARSLAPRSINEEAIGRIRAQLRLDDPMIVQLGHYVAGLLRGDFGLSYVQRRPVLDLILDRLPATAMLATAGVLVEVAIGVPLGMFAALRRAGRRIVLVTNLGLLSIPSFVLGLLLLLFLGFRLQIVPVIGGAGLAQLVLPALTLGLVGVPYYSQIVAEEMTQSLASLYVRSAVAKGLSNRRIVLVHAFPNVVPPVITLLGLDLGAFLSGVVVVEAVFGWPGVGLLAVQSLESLDRPVILGIALFAAIGVGLFNLLADVARMIIDPRTREELT